MTQQAPIIMWFRRDLRLSDNPALQAASTKGAVVAIYIYDESVEFAGASRVGLQGAIVALKQSLNGRLSIYKGEAATIIAELAERVGATALYYNRVYEPAALASEQAVQRRLDRRLAINAHNGGCLLSPSAWLKSDGQPYRLFTPFYRHVLPQLQSLPPTLAVPRHLQTIANKNDTIDERIIDDCVLAWQVNLQQQWPLSEPAAHKRLQSFCTNKLQHYNHLVNTPAEAASSRLSPYLHFGLLSPTQALQAVRESAPWVAQEFVRQLIWREFSIACLYYFPHIVTENYRREFDRFCWRDDTQDIFRWQQGQTGIPIVDAGMRQLWQEGFIPNRIRMIVASFLLKNVLVHWRHGQQWFEHTLIDADMANNALSWQWVAGTGIGAAPFFRIFNPVAQALKYDSNGHYVRRYVPELSQLSNKEIHNPWLLAENKRAQINYPQPMVDLAASRQRALDRYKRMRQ